jgi:hypothetical protein
MKYKVIKTKLKNNLREKKSKLLKTDFFLNNNNNGIIQHIFFCSLIKNNFLYDNK